MQAIKESILATIVSFDTKTGHGKLVRTSDMLLGAPTLLDFNYATYLADGPFQVGDEVVIEENSETGDLYDIVAIVDQEG